MIIKSQDNEQCDLLNQNHFHFLLRSVCAYLTYTCTQTTHIFNQGHFLFFFCKHSDRHKWFCPQRYYTPYKYNIDTQGTNLMVDCRATSLNPGASQCQTKKKVRVTICLKGKSPVLAPENQQLHFTLEDLVFPSRTWHPRVHFDWSQDFKFTWSWPKTLTTTRLHMPFWKVQEGVVLQIKCLLNQGMLFPSCSPFCFFFSLSEMDNFRFMFTLHIN